MQRYTVKKQGFSGRQRIPKGIPKEMDVLTDVFEELVALLHYNCEQNFYLKSLELEFSSMQNVRSKEMRITVLLRRRR